MIKKIVVIGPVYPYKGGISHYTGLLVRALGKKYETVCYSYSMQYPKLLFKREQKDYTNKSFCAEDTKYEINTANPFNWGKSAGLIRAEKPDLVIISWWHPYFAPCYQGLTAHLKGIPVAFLCHNVLPHERFPLDSVLTKATLKRAAFAIVHSEGDKEDLNRLLPEMKVCKQVHPTYNAFKMKDMPRGEARKILGLDEESPMILFFGYVRKYKGLDILINAMSESRVRPKLYIVGDFGKDKEEYLKLIEDKGIRDLVHIEDGYVPDTEVEKFFAAADLCVCPYRSATQSGIVQIAYGFGLPVIVTKVGGLPEVVDDGRTGYVVKPEDPEALIAAIDSYFSENRQAEFAENVRAESRRFSWDRMVETIEGAYEEICDTDTRI
ncbi:MAG: glycosyltransferase [Lachnospiraceae bacterium]|nr:glycosyltransferase [Lachnospiraceae bacterium]